MSLKVVDYQFVDLAVTDLRFYETDERSWTPRPDAVQDVNRRMRLGVKVILAVGLTRPWASGGDDPVRWLQINNLHLEDDPLWSVSQAANSTLPTNLHRSCTSPAHPLQIGPRHSGRATNTAGIERPTSEEDTMSNLKRLLVGGLGLLLFVALTVAVASADEPPVPTPGDPESCPYAEDGAHAGPHGFGQMQGAMTDDQIAAMTEARQAARAADHAEGEFPCLDADGNLTPGAHRGGMSADGVPAFARGFMQRFQEGSGAGFAGMNGDGECPFAETPETQ